MSDIESEVKNSFDDLLMLLDGLNKEGGNRGDFFESLNTSSTFLGNCILTRAHKLFIDNLRRNPGLRKMSLDFYIRDCLIDR